MAFYESSCTTNGYSYLKVKPDKNYDLEQKCVTVCQSKDITTLVERQKKQTPKEGISEERLVAIV